MTATAGRAWAPSRSRALSELFFWVNDGVLFENFVTEDTDVGEEVVHVRHGGHGPTVLLLHGHPHTGATWYRIAPTLVGRGFRVVVPHLRGYGASRGPAPAAD